jgi:transcriptional regulator with GAF, ATPase, and Fis domain
MRIGQNNRFDPNQTLDLLLAIAHENSLGQILAKLTCTEIDHSILAGVQVWLVENGDQCLNCPHRAACSDQTRCLHLAVEGGSAFTSLGLAEAGKLRLPIGFNVVGRVAASGRQIVQRDVHSHPEVLSGLAVPKHLDIHVMNAAPISYKGELLGVIAGFICGNPPSESLPWGQVFADHIGAAIANARAFREIERLKAQLELQNDYLQEEVVEAKAFGDLIGTSAALKQINSQIDLVAPTEASVLILGETGTGKELVAHEIHRRSNRKHGPLVRVNCASVPRDLFESEFFGHVRGAFTGAISDRAGRFETADRGTLFLDEVGEIPLEMQGKLLRVLQERKYERVGEDRTRTANVRIIGATNRDLLKAVANRTFREDLYYRLHVFPIQVIPLRNRTEDIPLLARHFIELSVKDLRCVTPRLTKAAIDCLQAYHWPGNVRELRNVIERAVILARGRPLTFDLPVTEGRSGVSNPRLQGSLEYLTEAQLRQRERDNFLAVLKAARGRVKGRDGAAELLGVHPATFFSRMKKMGIDGYDQSDDAL